jgi:flagellar motility protein MotE (MotC chaperone)
MKASALFKLRLFPAVAGAAAALLILKVADLAFAPTPAPEKGAFAQGFTKVRGTGERLLDPLVTGSTPAKKKEEPPAEPARPAGLPVNLERAPGSPGEKALLERLGERREVLDERQRELDTRENLLKAADRKLETRINELKELETKAKETAAAEPGGAQALKNLVTMYETMKPKEAARVFEKLDMAVLVPVVNSMNPRKMAEVLAAMSPEAASKLTVELATRGQKVANGNGVPSGALPAGELPAIEPRRP